MPHEAASEPSRGSSPNQAAFPYRCYFAAQTSVFCFAMFHLLILSGLKTLRDTMWWFGSIGFLPQDNSHFIAAKGLS